MRLSRNAPALVGAIGFLLLISGTAVVISGWLQAPAVASTPPTLTGAYELYCPSTPVGNIVLNGAVTSATLSPANPTAGQAFSVTGYQTVVNLPHR